MVSLSPLFASYANRLMPAQGDRSAVVRAMILHGSSSPADGKGTGTNDSFVVGEPSARRVKSSGLTPDETGKKALSTQWRDGDAGDFHSPFSGKDPEEDSLFQISTGSVDEVGSSLPGGEDGAGKRRREPLSVDDPSEKECLYG